MRDDVEEVERLQIRLLGKEFDELQMLLSEIDRVMKGEQTIADLLNASKAKRYFQNSLLAAVAVRITLLLESTTKERAFFFLKDQLRLSDMTTYVEAYEKLIAYCTELLTGMERFGEDAFVQLRRPEA